MSRRSTEILSRDTYFSQGFLASPEGFGWLVVHTWYKKKDCATIELERKKKKMKTEKRSK